MSKLVVHRFELYDPIQDHFTVARGWGTAETIEKLHGKIIPNSQREIETSELTETGRWHEPPQTLSGFQAQVKT